MREVLSLIPFSVFNPHLCTNHKWQPFNLTVRSKSGIKTGGVVTDASVKEFSGGSLKRSNNKRRQRSWQFPKGDEVDAAAEA